jgi:hypothetical protein
MMAGKPIGEIKYYAGKESGLAWLRLYCQYSLGLIDTRRNGVLEMTTNVLVAFYGTYGHVHRMALAVAEGAGNVPDSTVRLRRIAAGHP